MTTFEDRLTLLDSLTLDHGSHQSFEEGHCALEVLSWLAGLGFTDAPECASLVLRAFTISLNDSWPAEQRQLLKPYLPRMIGTAGDGQDEARSFLALDWLIRVYTPAWLRLVPALVPDANLLANTGPITTLDEAAAIGDTVREIASRSAAAWAAAWAAAGAALAPTVTALQASALELLDRMIDPSAVSA